MNVFKDIFKEMLNMIMIWREPRDKKAEQGWLIKSSIELLAICGVKEIQIKHTDWLALHYYLNMKERLVEYKGVKLIPVFLDTDDMEGYTN